MNNLVLIDWKALAVLGLTVVGIVLVIEDPKAGSEALVHVSDAVKECAAALKSSN